MSRVLDGSADFLEVAHGIHHTFPVSASIWFNPDNTDSTKTLMSSYDTGVSDDYWAVFARGSSDKVELQTRAGSTPFIRNPSNLFVASAWQHVCIVLTSTSLGEIFLDADIASRGTGPCRDIDTNTPDRFRVGNGSGGGFFAGPLAELIVWDAALVSDEITALFNRRISASQIRPDKIKGNFPLWGLHDPEIDLSPNKHSLTLTSAPPRGNHAPVRPFSRMERNTIPLIEVAAGGLSIPVAMNSYRQRHQSVA